MKSREEVMGEYNSRRWARLNKFRKQQLARMKRSGNPAVRAAAKDPMAPLRGDS